MKRWSSKDSKDKDDPVGMEALKELLQETKEELKEAFKVELQNIMVALRHDIQKKGFGSNTMRLSRTSSRLPNPGRRAQVGNLVRGSTSFKSIRTLGENSPFIGTVKKRATAMGTAASVLGPTSMAQKLSEVTNKAASAVTGRATNYLSDDQPSEEENGEAWNAARKYPDKSSYSFLAPEVPDPQSRAGTVSSFGTASSQFACSRRGVQTQNAGAKIRDMTFESSSDEEVEEVDDGFPSLTEFVSHQYFHFVVSCVILLNAFSVGLETDYMARHWTLQTPFVYGMLDLVTCIFFIAEMALRIIAFRFKFFTNRESSHGNIFDLLCAIGQSMELYMPASSMQSLFVLVRTMRLLRLFRLHIFQQITELRMIVVSVRHALKSLFYTLLVIVQVVYIVGICVTQFVTSNKVDLPPEHEDNRELEKFFGTLPRSLMSLYETVSDGIHWHELIAPLREHCEFPVVVDILFSLYMAFMVFAMMNVITGHIVEGAFAVAETDKRKELVRKMRHGFNAFDINGTGTITWDDFRQHLQRDDKTKHFLREIDLDPYEAISLFSYLDKDHKNEIETEQFVEGCTRFRGAAKVSHIMAFMEAWQEHADYVEQVLDTIATGEQLIEEDVTKLASKTSQLSNRYDLFENALETAPSGSI